MKVHTAPPLGPRILKSLPDQSRLVIRLDPIPFLDLLLLLARRVAFLGRFRFHQDRVRAAAAPAAAGRDDVAAQNGVVGLRERRPFHLVVGGGDDVEVLGEGLWFVEVVPAQRQPGVGRVGDAVGVFEGLPRHRRDGCARLGGLV